ncbi:MAG: hypothetical protein KAS49_08750 [Candidatus Cloacimonetes bacterium]|nr:hypothetical protein [Candidatus Cloacimonadota bacterium]
MFYSVHITLAGIKDLIIPPLGVLENKLIGVRSVFNISPIMVLAGSLLSLELYFKMDKKTCKLISELAKSTV